MCACVCVVGGLTMAPPWPTVALGCLEAPPVSSALTICLSHPVFAVLAEGCLS